MERYRAVEAEEKKYEVRQKSDGTVSLCGGGTEAILRGRESVAEVWRSGLLVWRRNESDFEVRRR